MASLADQKSRADELFRQSWSREVLVDEDGAYRVEARLGDDVRGRLWLVGNPVYVRAG